MSAQFRCLDIGTPMTVRRDTFRKIVQVDQYSDTSWLDDEARLDAFESGAWHMIGVQAEAAFLIPINGHYVVQTVKSPGLWGIESDSDEDYLDVVYGEQCAELESMLSVLGVSITP